MKAEKSNGKIDEKSSRLGEDFAGAENSAGRIGETCETGETGRTGGAGETDTDKNEKKPSPVSLGSIAAAEKSREKNRKTAKVILAVGLAAALGLGALGYQKLDDYVLTHPAENLPAENISEIDGSSDSSTPDIAPAVGETAGEPVVFSLEPGFYDSAQRLALSADGAEKILYTRDGSDPRVDGHEYKSGIPLSASGSKTKIYDISACAVYPDGSVSEPVTRSYITGKDVSNRFDCLVFSITIDPDYLYNYEDGIFIEGKMRDDYLALPAEERYPGLQPTDPANWNQRGRAGERPCYVEVFEYDGTPIISQSCGLRIFGGWSRSNDQKNLKLYARTEYDETDNRFRYEFFPDALDSSGNKIASYKKLALRACANDSGYLYARDDAISATAKATGIEVKESRPAAVFLNGEYYGFAWLQQVFSEDLLDHKYNVEDGSWDIIKGCEYMMIEDQDDPDWERKNAAWREMYDYAYKDLTDDRNFEELSKLIDVDNFLTYYALNSYIGNGDWPNNNYKVFRYSSGSVPKSDEAPYDGRWRFMLYDTDFAYGLYGNDFLSTHMQQLFKEDFFGTFPEDWRLDVHDQGDMYYKRSDLLIAMCKRPEIRDRFVSILCDISGYYFNEERAGAYLDEYCEKRLHELVAAANEGRAMVWGLDRELLTCKNYLTKRDYALKVQMAKVFPDNYDKENVFFVKAYPADGAVINLNTANIVSDGVAFDGWYFGGMEIPLSCTLEEDVEFVSYEINGETVTERDTVISKEKYGENIEIKLNVRRTGGIKIYQVVYKGSAGGDCVVIKNYSENDLSTQGYVISDGSNEFILPTMNVKPGAEVRMIGKNYSRVDALGAVELGFNLKEGETVTLKNADGETVSEVPLRIAHRRTGLQLDPFADRYIEFSVNYKDRTLEAEIPVPDWGNWW